MEKKIKMLTTLRYISLISIDILNLTPHTAYKTCTGMKDNFVFFPHFTRSDAIKQYSGPTTDTNTHTKKKTGEI